MSRRYPLVLKMLQSTAWFIEPVRANQIVSALLVRMEAGRGLGLFLTDDQRETNAARHEPHIIGGVGGQGKEGVKIAVLGIVGAILPRGDAVADMSGGGAVNLLQFQQQFAAVAADQSIDAIVIEFDSPGGQVTQVPETAAQIAAAVKASPDRPVVAAVNAMAASAAYWIAAACSQISVTPSGHVGSIGAYMLHVDESMALEMEGLVPTFIFEGARKIEGHPLGPLDDVAAAQLQREVREAYDLFTRDVARGRGVPVSTVRRDPEGAGTGPDFGGGRVYSAQEAVTRGMADRVETLAQTIARLQTPRGRKSKAARMAGADRARALLTNKLRARKLALM